MFYLYFDRDLIAQSEKFSEIADIIIVEILNNCESALDIVFYVVNGLLAYDHALVNLRDSTLEVYYGRNA